MTVPVLKDVAWWYQIKLCNEKSYQTFQQKYPAFTLSQQSQTAHPICPDIPSPNYSSAELANLCSLAEFCNLFLLLLFYLLEQVSLMKTAFTKKVLSFLQFCFVLFWIHVVICLFMALALSFITKWPSGHQYINSGFADKTVFKISRKHYPWAMVILAKW